MAYRTIEEAKSEIGHHFEMMTAAIDAAHKEFMEQCGGIAHKLHARSKASIYRDLILRKLREFCDETPGATVIRRGQLNVIGLESKWLVRVKRLRNGFTVAVSPTAASRAFNANEVPESIASLFPDVPPATCVYLGWTVPRK